MAVINSYSDVLADPPTPAHATASAHQPHGPASGEGLAERPAPLSARKVRLCRYFGTAPGCRAGENCAFLHDLSRLAGNVRKSETEENAGPSTSTPPGQGERQQAVTKPVPSRVVSKPIPKAQTDDPREFQLRQIRRRFSPRETRLSLVGDGEDASVLNFSMAPSDPDFPFEMDKLQCSLVVPASYSGPDGISKPRLKVTNKDIPRGFAINIERGFDKLVEEQKKDSTLLALMSALDKSLERFLSEKRAETAQLVANADRRHLAAFPMGSLGVPPERAQVQENVDCQPKVQPGPVEVFTDAQRAEAQPRRDLETRQLEARLGRVALYKKSADGVAYTIPIEPRNRSELPLPIQVVKTVQLFVPLSYPLQCCRIKLEGVKPEDANNTEMAFEEHAKQSRDMSLMSHINYLAQNIHILAKTTPKPEPKTEKPVVQAQEEKVTPSFPKISQIGTTGQESEDHRMHTNFILRPPEWAMVDSSGISDTESDYSYDSGDETEDGGIELDVSDQGGALVVENNPERGTALSFPFIELYGIELLELTNLNLTIKCERCKDTMDVTNLKTNSPKSESCKKCAAILGVGFRRDFIHVNAVRAGFLDFEGCTIVDMLPSTFIPTCSNCSTVYPTSPGFISVRGSRTTNPCRICHQRLTIHIPNVRFLRITSSDAAPSTAPRRKKSEALGLVTGTELPDRGRCRHYAKSYRWFRFSCCSRVFPCDRCHDEKEEHPNEHANRMICGWCSREQTYRPEDCAFCGKGVVGRKGSGFWEGGKGTRDRVRMSRKDPRKHKRVGGEAKVKAKAKV